MAEFALLKLFKALTKPKTFSQLLEETKLPERTLRYNLTKLKNSGLVYEFFTLNDMRKKVFVLKVGKDEDREIPAKRK